MCRIIYLFWTLSQAKYDFFIISNFWHMLNCFFTILLTYSVKLLIIYIISHTSGSSIRRPYCKVSATVVVHFQLQLLHLSTSGKRLHVCPKKYKTMTKDSKDINFEKITKETIEYVYNYVNASVCDRRNGACVFGINYCNCGIKIHLSQFLMQITLFVWCKMNFAIFYLKYGLCKADGFIACNKIHKIYTKCIRDFLVSFTLIYVI